MTLIECIPNISEGRNAGTINRIADVIRDTPDVDLLNISSDVDHNRTVFTFIGNRHSIIEAAYHVVDLASQLIDLSQHSGVHPRIGATDVVPFVPLRDASMQDCVEIAHALGEQVANRLQIPVYFYENAALRDERRNLAYVRRDKYEQLLQSITSDPTRKPDLGPAALGSAGAVAIGAREPLIAFNAYLDTPNIDTARAIARRLRESSGGLRYVKALGLMVNGQAQVSMNVVNFRETSLFEIMQALHDAASDHHVRVAHTEIVGLVPQSALVDCALSYLQLSSESRNLLLERQIGHVIGDYREITFE